VKSRKRSVRVRTRKFYAGTYQVPDRAGGLPFNIMRKCPGAKLPRGSQETPQFRAAYFAALAGKPVVEMMPAKRKVRDGTWGAMMIAHEHSNDYAILVKKDDRQRAFKEIREEMHLGDVLVAQTDFVLVAEYIDTVKQKTAGWARILRSNLSVLCSVAIARGHINANPIREIKRPELANIDGLHDWTEPEIAQYEAHHLAGTMARYALDVGLETGLRLSDMHRVGDQHVDADGLVNLIPWKTRKLGERARVFIPVTDKLRMSAAAMDVVVPIGGKPATATWLVKPSGGAFTADYLGENFAKWIDEAKLPKHCTPHGLRKAFVRRHIDAGESPEDVAVMTGHQDLALVMFYARKRNQRLAALRVKARQKAA
jgi:integrase